MKKFLCLIAATMVVSSAFSQAYTKELECSHLNIYMTSDTVKYYKDPDTGEVTVYPWNASTVSAGMQAAGYPTGTGSTTDLDYVFAFRKDYTDPQTGFTVKKGYYRAPFIDDGNMNLYGGTGEGSSQHGYTNLKGVVLYFVGLPQTWITSPVEITHQDFPTGRVFAQYNDPETGSKVSNLAYREIHTSMSHDFEGKTSYFCATDSNIVYGLPKFMGYQLHASADGKSIDPRHVTYDQPFKLVIWLDNSIDEKTVNPETDFQKREDPNNPGVYGEKGEWIDMSADNKVEEEFAYYFGDLTEQNPYWNEPDKIGTDCTTGRNCVTGTWSKKLTWTTSTPVAWGVKKRMVLIGVSMIGGSEAMPPKYINCSDGEYAEEKMGDGEAYGSNPANEYFPATTEKIDAGDAFSDRPFLRNDFIGPGSTPTPGGKKGDANNDGNVDVTDITTIASKILGTTPAQWNETNADANSDGNIDVTDITTTAGIILGN